jgi:uncharacterized membrane protein
MIDMWKRWGIPIVAAIFTAAVSVFVYQDLPDPMAIHFSVNNEPDNFASRIVGAFMIPVLLVVLPMLINFSARLEKDGQKVGRHLEMSGTVNAAVSIVLVAVHLLAIAYNLGYDIDISFYAPLVAGGLFIVVGNVLPRAPQGTLRLFRMKEEAYARYARFSGRVLVGAGFVIMAAALLPGRAAGYAVVAILAVLVLCSIVSAVYFSRQANTR